MEIKGKSVIRRCRCGKVHQHGIWQKPDFIQTQRIAESVNSGCTTIENEKCDYCRHLGKESGK